MKLHTVFSSLLMVLPFNLLAAPAAPYYNHHGYPGSMQSAIQQSNPGVLLREGIEKVLAFLEGGGASQRDKLVNFVEREIAGYFDFESMTRWSLGARGRFMSPQQRNQAEQQLRGMFLNALVSQLAKYEPGRVRYLPPRNKPYSNEMMLSIASISRSGHVQRLDFHFYRDQQGWRIYDVAANGLRATSVYREYFREQSAYRGRPYYRQSR